MDNFNELRNKLEAFIRRYYLNELLKGAIFFVSIGLLYFLITLSLEHFFWLNSTKRQILFWSFVLVEVLLFVKFIIVPLLKLFRLSKGLNYAQASRIIGDHFPEVKDKLLNLLQLKENNHQSELLLAGIDQKAQELKPVPFNMAVDFKSNLPFLKYAAIPVLIILLIFVTGQSNMFADSYERVVHYKKAYVPPAPFAFNIMNGELKARANEPFTLRINTVGNVLPESPSIHYRGQTYFLNKVSPGLFEYEFEALKESVNFNFSGNEVTSGNYTLEVVEVPEMTDFKMHLNFPDYTGLEDEIVDGSGNATVPEGTSINWKLNTLATEEVSFRTGDTINQFQKEGNGFAFDKEILKALRYEISTSNKEVKNYENLDYEIAVVKDQYPELELEQKIDSVDTETQYFYGKVSDDYGISGVQLVYYPTEKSEDVQRRSIPISKAAYAEFLFAFPDTLNLQKGKSYEYYFQAFDNDAVNNRKSVKSSVFYFRRKTEDEKKEERLNQQSDAIKGLDNSLEKLQFSREELEEISRLQKQKKELNYSDRKKLENFLDRQKKQNAMMKEYAENLKKSLNGDSPREKNKLKEQLEERLKNREDKLEENEDLLEELRKYGEKINEEELGEKLEKLSRNNQNQEKSLEQLLELTKKYYVEEKAAKISRDLEKLALEQEKLAEDDEANNKDAQDSLNEEFNEIRENLKELEEENRKLQKPTETGSDEQAEEEIKKEQEKASESLEKQQKSDAKKNQKNASEKMKELSSKMKQQQQMSAGEQLQEDAVMLRKILDNLVIFSFEQEELLDNFKEMGRDNPGFASGIKRQNIIKEHFQHVDDSLYALALRNPMITENITEKLTDIEFDLDKALDRLAQNRLPQGLASQQYVVTGANDLAYFLSQILGNMENMMSSSSSGGGRGDMQLPDIIKKQEQLGEEMKEGLEKQKQQQGKEKRGEEGERQGEEENGELFRIFQEQQILRQLLEDRLEKEGLGDKGKALKEDMEKIEEDLLNSGFNEETLRKMQNLEHKLLELEGASLEQGQKMERESNTNTEEFENTSKNQILKAKEYFNTTEILNRQTLPLRQIYKRKVKEYFERGDH
ncbi:ATPase [Salinimicrobium marinum]|uniref:ATPase n=1 Tax=Salinimicrobium marinum TaxID=680283 RepID=A0A918SF71_9FLAO|nr:DUF4175 family protein [Salinimicrobium marinum]GHA38865.1 ATPase [Salinimicrobium marinum]